MWRIMPTKATCAGIFEQSMGARDRVGGIGLSFRPASLQRLAESILGLLKSLKIRALHAQSTVIPAFDTIEKTSDWEQQTLI
jgi:hypothetical protein